MGMLRIVSPTQFGALTKMDLGAVSTTGLTAWRLRDLTKKVGPRRVSLENLQTNPQHPEGEAQTMPWWKTHRVLFRGEKRFGPEDAGSGLESVEVLRGIGMMVREGTEGEEDRPARVGHRFEGSRVSNRRKREASPPHNALYWKGFRLPPDE